jgi:glutamyl-tRNA reductase
MLANDEDPLKVMETLSATLTNKLMHGPTVEMRKALKQDDHKTIDLLHSLLKNG